MSRRHGRAVLPWGKYRGVRIRLLPDSYLSWLTTSAILKEPKWWWLKESLLAELDYRGLRVDLADTPDPEIPEEPKRGAAGERKLRIPGKEHMAKNDPITMTHSVQDLIADIARELIAVRPERPVGLTKMSEVLIVGWAKWNRAIDAVCMALDGNIVGFEPAVFLRDIGLNRTVPFDEAPEDQR